jgi:hypothetical protein
MSVSIEALARELSQIWELLREVFNKEAIVAIIHSIAPAMNTSR